jgi:DNA-binding XRE family transcriptional regulator
MMDDRRFGTAIRSVRIRRGWRQTDLASKSGISKSAISRLERGDLGPHSLHSIRAVATALEIRVDLIARWRAGDLDRLLNARHSALHESVARWFQSTNPAWVVTPEVTFAIYGDRGIIDMLAWHPGRRAVLIIELKTDIADVNELLGTLDRKRRLGRKVAEERGLAPMAVSAWLIVADSRTNRRRLEAHRAMVGSALPDSGPSIRQWLRDPLDTRGAVSFWSAATARRGVVVVASRRRVGVRRTARLARPDDVIASQ